jgi:hypothetical protein
MIKYARRAGVSTGTVSAVLNRPASAPGAPRVKVQLPVAELGSATSPVMARVSRPRTGGATVSAPGCASRPSPAGTRARHVAAGPTPHGLQHPHRTLIEEPSTSRQRNPPHTRRASEPPGTRASRGGGRAAASAAPPTGGSGASTSRAVVPQRSISVGCQCGTAHARWLFDRVRYSRVVEASTGARTFAALPRACGPDLRPLPHIANRAIRCMTNDRIWR